jgi:hypothetical protein
MGQSVETLLDGMTAQELLQWMAYLAVREERRAQAHRDAADAEKYGDDDEVTYW